MCVGKKVTSEVKRVMGSGSPSLSYNTPTRSLSNLLGSNQIPRKPKRKAKFEVAAQKYGTKKKGRSSTATFQKKLVVFQFMGTDAPKTFTRADKRICMRGLLPPIGVDCSESEIRAKICTAICTCTDPDLTDCGLDDFDFIDMNGKQAGIPKCKSGFEWDGRAVKELACLLAALALYKQSRFNAHAGLQVSIRGQPGIDTGGVRRQFFSGVLTKLAQSSPPFCFFDGDPNRLRPAFKATTLSSGMMTTIGTMIAHSIVLDGQGFPFLAEYCFYYIAGCVDRAITCIGTEDVGADVAHILNKV